MTLPSTNWSQGGSLNVLPQRFRCFVDQEAGLLGCEREAQAARCLKIGCLIVAAIQRRGDVIAAVGEHCTHMRGRARSSATRRATWWATPGPAVPGSLFGAQSKSIATVGVEVRSLTRTTEPSGL